MRSAAQTAPVDPGAIEINGPVGVCGHCLLRCPQSGSNDRCLVSSVAIGSSPPTCVVCDLLSTVLGGDIPGISRFLKVFRDMSVFFSFRGRAVCLPPSRLVLPFQKLAPAFVVLVSFSFR